MKMLIGKAVSFGAKSGGTVADITEINLLTDGAFACFDEDGTYINGGAAITGSELTFALGGGTATGAKSIGGINRATLTWDVEAYSALVQQVSYVGYDGAVGTLNLPSAIAKGDVYGFYLIDTSVNEQDPRRQIRIEVEATASSILTGVTSANIIVQLIAQFNANTEATSRCTIAAIANGGNTVGFSLTGVNSHPFVVKPYEKLVDADTRYYKEVNGVYDGSYTTATAFYPGAGVATRVKELYDKAKARLGDSGYPYSEEFYSQESNYDSTIAYELHHLQYNGHLDGFSNNNPYPLTLILVVPNSAADAKAKLAAIKAAI